KKGYILLHDDARQHVASTIVQKLHRFDIEILSYLPYFPDLSSVDLGTRKI
ncbi:hypothetical protein WH47_02335, partial [Habropoda laboriosa]